MEKDTELTHIIWGRHPVLSALKAGRPCQRLLIARGSHGPVIDELYDLAREKKIPFDVVDRTRLDQAVSPNQQSSGSQRHKTGSHYLSADSQRHRDDRNRPTTDPHQPTADTQHQGVVLYVAAHTYVEYEQILQQLNPKNAFLVFLDGVQDPHNLGAIIRSAHAVAADALIIPERGAAGLTATALKAAAGAAEHLPVCRVKNLYQAMEKCRQAGVWITGLAAAGEHEFSTVDFNGPSALVIGGEGKGLRPRVLQGCDFIARIPMARTEIGSFNASVAAGLVLYEVFRQRRIES